MTRHQVVLLPGDGIGPEVTDAARRVLDASGAKLDWEVHQVGLTARAAGEDPLPDRVVRAIEDRKVALKGPLTTPPDGSMPSVNMALRRELSLYASARHVRRYAGVPGPLDEVDLILIRETTEDVYAGIEFAAGDTDAERLADWLRDRGKRVPAGAALAVKVTSAAGARRVFEFAAGYAARYSRKHLTVVHKSTVLPATDGLFVDVGREVLAAHPELAFDAMAVDTLAAHLVERPGELDVLVLPCQYGDIMADLAGALVGGIGMVPGVNHGGEIALFEPAHGSTPRQAGRNRANPVAAILSGALMLHHLGEHAAASRVERAVAVTLAGGRRTYDLTPNRSGQGAIGTAEFATAVIAELA